VVPLDILEDLDRGHPHPTPVGGEVPDVVLIRELLNGHDDLRVVPAVKEVRRAGSQGVVVDVLLAPVLRRLRPATTLPSDLDDVVAHAGVERLPLREGIHEVTS